MDGPSAERLRLAGVVGLCLSIVAFWMAQHPYWGLVNDATLYALAALGRLHPESLGHDIFLSQGSQDQYTIFSPLLAPMISVAGIARAAAIVTFIAQAGFFGCAWILARRLMGSSLAILSVALLVALPAFYGGASIFSYSETMLTPRVPAEAFVLAALAAALGRRYAISGVCILMGLLLHPLMAAAGLVMVFLLMIGPERQFAGLGLLLLGAGLLVLIAYVSPVGPVAPFDSEWFGLLHSRMQYAFPSLWARSDWGHASVPLATLAVGAISTTSPQVRSLCRAALLTGLCGLAVSLIASDLLHVVLIAQAQTWRWLWLANSLAVITLPITAADCWRAGKLGQAALLLLGAAWLCIDQSFTWIAAGLAVIVTVIRDRAIDGRQRHLIVLGARAALLLCALVFAGSLWSALSKSASLLQSPAWLLAGIIPACALTMAWWWVMRGASRLAAPAVLALGLALCTCFAPASWRTWTQLSPSDELRSEFASWREQIPLTAQVLAPGVPLIPWFILERPSYWSLRQMAGSVFSRPTTMELVKRESALRGQVATDQRANDLVAICRNNSPLGYLITPADLGPTAFAPVSVGKSQPDLFLHLYRCSDYRH